MAAPTAPGNLTATVLNPSEISLSWTPSTDPSGGQVGYTIYRNGAVLTAVSSNSYSGFTISNLSPGTTYTFSVQACNAIQSCSMSATISATTAASTDTTPPSVPSSLTATANGPTEITVTWLPSTDNVDVYYYDIYRNGTLVVTHYYRIGYPTSYTLKNLNPNTSYSITVLACDTSNNCSTQSTPATATTAADTTSPSTPTGLTGSANGGGKINLSWNASTDNVGVDRYKIYMNGTLWVTMDAYYNSGQKNYTITGLMANTSYTFAVAACDISGNCSAQSSAITVKTAIDTTPPTVPTNLTATAASSTSVNLNWIVSTDDVNVDRYKIYANGILWITIEGYNSTSQKSFTVTGLTSNTNYSFTVVACDLSANCSTPSSAASVKTPAAVDTTAPTMPTGLTATANGGGKVDLSWPASTDNIGVDRYKIYMNGALWVTIEGYTSTGQKSYTVTGLMANTSYSFAIAACDIAGNCSAQSPTVSAKTAVDTTPPTVPTGLTATAASATSANLSWTVSTDDVNVDRYKIYANGALWVTIEGYSSTSQKSYTVTGLTANTNYSFTVVACDLSGNCSTSSTVANVKTSVTADTTPPSAPTDLVAIPNGANGAFISWSAATDNVGVTDYKLYRNNGFLTSVGNTTSHTDSGLAASTDYTYNVSACDAAGNCSTQSIPVLVTTSSTTGKLTSVKLTCVTSIASGKTGSCSATASYAAGSSKTVVPNWSISPDAAATIDAAGVITAKSVTVDTPAVVGASYTEGGVTMSATADVTILAATVTAGCSSTKPNTAAITVAGNPRKKAGEPFSFGYCMKNFDHNSKHDIYAAVMLPDGTLLFITTGLFGTISFTTDAKPYMTSVDGSDRDLTILNIASLSADLPLGKYTFYAVPVLAGKNIFLSTNWIGQLAQGEFTLDK